VSKLDRPKFYEVQRPLVPNGDNGDILVHGWAPDRVRGTLVVERSGPFVPPLSQPTRKLVVTDVFRKQLEGSGLTGLKFATVQLRKVPWIEWRQWEPYGPLEFRPPAGGEPENYLLRRKHSEKAAKAVGKLWELRLAPGITVLRDGVCRPKGRTWTGLDFFSASVPFTYRFFVTERACDWLLDHVPEWVELPKVDTDWS
jgi:hypothetical protein